jgi:hypothetical protein
MSLKTVYRSVLYQEGIKICENPSDDISDVLKKIVEIFIEISNKLRIGRCLDVSDILDSRN